MAEGGVDRITAMRVAGHVTERMWSKYHGGNPEENGAHLKEVEELAHLSIYLPERAGRAAGGGQGIPELVEAPVPAAQKALVRNQDNFHISDE
jgi:hypothetical protein